MIYLSAGHNEARQGASFGDVTEFKLTTKWVDVIAGLLGDRCVRVPGGSLPSKINFINNRTESRDLAVEIHFNSAKQWKDWDKDGLIDPGEMVHVGRGSESLYYPGKVPSDRGSVKGKKAAFYIQDVLGRIFPPNRGAKPGWYQMNPAKGPDYFLARTDCVAIIIEPEFIDNLDAINSNFDIACHAIANALVEIQQELL